MFSKILDCPLCNKRFSFEHGDHFPDMIDCPGCGQSSPKEDYFAVVLCSSCRCKVKVPLPFLNHPENLCPQCETPLTSDTLSPFDDDAYGSTLSGMPTISISNNMLQEEAVFDKYKIIRLLGKGGMAEVYLAEHLLLQQKCAIKLMYKNLSQNDQVFTKRFVREAKLSHKFNSPHIVKVLDAGSDFKTGYLFLAMEYVEGKTLQELSRTQTFTEKELRLILQEMALALQTLNNENVVHRDIKPSNIMKTPEGIYKLMDLGIAKSSSSSSGEMTLTMEQTTIGTPGYASPEQCRSAHNADIRSDIYCLGATIYHLASGIMPFDGDTPVEVILKVLQEEAEPLKTHRPDLSPKLLNLVTRMMKKNPDERPASPEELLACLSGKENIFTRMRDFFKPSFEYLQKKFLVTTPGKMLKMLLGKTLKLAVFLLLALAISCSALFLYQHHYRNQKISFKDFLNNLLRQNPVPPAEKTPESRLQLEALATYPGEKGKLRAFISPNTGLTHAPEIKFLSDDSEHVIANFTFDKMPAISSIKPARLKDGILHFDGTQRVTEYKKSKYTSRPQTQTVVENIFLTNKFLNQITLSADVSLSKADSGTIFSIGGIDVNFADQKIHLILHGRYRVDTFLKFEFNEFFNFSFSVDIDNRMLTFFSSNTLLGTYLLPDIKHMPYQKIEFASSNSAIASACKFDRLTVYKTARRYQTPPVSAINYVQLTGWSISPKVPKQQQTLEHRIFTCQQKLRRLLSEPATPNKQERTAFIQKQINALQKQIAIRDAVVNTLAQDYPKKPTTALKTRLEKYLANRYKNPHIIPSQSEVEELVFQLRDPAVNPNLKVSSPWDNGQEKPFAHIVAMHESIFSPLTVDALITRHANFNQLVPDRNLPLKFLLQGRDEIDLPQKDHLMHQARLAVEKFPYTFGRKYNTAQLKEFLLLSPPLDAVDANGRNLMHIAAEANDAELVKYLFYAGFTRGKEPDKQKRTPWQVACSLGSTDAIKAMQELNLMTDQTGKDLLQLRLADALQKQQYTALRQVCKQGASTSSPWYNGMNALQNACALNDVKAVEALLEARSNPNNFIPVPGKTAVQSPAALAVARGNAEMLTLLLKHGASTGNCATIGNTRQELVEFVLGRMAVDTNSDTVIRLLEVLKKHDPRWNINLAGNKSLLSICLAAKNNRENVNFSDFRQEVLTYLIQNGADISAPDVSEHQQMLARIKTPELDSDSQEDAGNDSAAEETVMLPKPVYPEDATIANRLEYCQKLYDYVKQQKDILLKKERLKFIKEQIAALQKQFKIRQKVLALSKQKQDDAALEFIRKGEQMLIYGRGYSQERIIKTTKELLALLKKTSTPNMYLNCRSDRSLVLSLVDIINSGYLQFTDQFAKLLIEKNADVNLSSRSKTRIEFLFFGKENIHSGNPLTFFFSPLDECNIPLLRQYLRLAPNGRDSFRYKGKTLMHIAAEQNNSALARELYFTGFSDLKEKNLAGHTPWETALLHGNTGVINTLRELKLETPCSARVMNQYNFWLSLRERRHSDIKKYLKLKVDPYQTDSDSFNALQLACKYGDNTMTEILLGNRISPNNFKFDSPNEFSNPLQLAVLAGNPHILTLLLKYDADTSPENPRFNHRCPDLARTILHRLEQDENANMVLALLRVQIGYDRHWDPNKKINGQSLLYYCAQLNSRSQIAQINVIQFLLQVGADPQITAAQRAALPERLRSFFAY